MPKTATCHKDVGKAEKATLTAMGKPSASSECATPSVSKVTVSISADTRCNTGPGSAYDRVFVFKTGQTVVAVGRDAASRYWVIQNPDNPSVTRWIRGKYATVTGDADSLPVMTPPLAPTAETSGGEEPSQNTAPGLATAASISLGKTQVDADCNFAKYMTISMMTDGSADVKYQVQIAHEWSQFKFMRAAVFSSAGTQVFNDSVSQTGCGKWLISVWVTSPNHKQFSQQSFMITYMQVP